MPPLRAAALSLLAAALLLAVPVLPGMDEGVRAGAAFAFGSPGRWLALLGLGFAFGAADRGGSRAGWAALAGGAALGVAARHSAIWPWITGPSVSSHRLLLGPGACLLSGLLLLTRNRWRTSLRPPAAFAVAAALLVTAALNDPAPERPAFVAGAAAAALALILAAAALRRLVAGRWTAIGEPIAGSWLLAIGLLLSAVRLLPAPAPPAEAPPPSPPAQTAAGPPGIPGLFPALPPGADRFSRPPGARGLPMGTN